jgi:hypothetical protein
MLGKYADNANLFSPAGPSLRFSNNVRGLGNAFLLPESWMGGTNSNIHRQSLLPSARPAKPRVSHVELEMIPAASEQASAGWRKAVLPRKPTL